MDFMIIKCATAYLRNVWTAMTAINKINDVPVLLRVLHVGGMKFGEVEFHDLGTIKCCQKAAISHFQEALRGQHQIQGPEQVFAKS